MQQLILVNKKDEIQGFKDKKTCHKKGLLHRAFSILVFNKKEELLVQQRSRHKLLWPGFWSNTCCSHPLRGRDIKESAEKRLKEELGFACSLEFLFKFLYRETYKDKGSENEVCYVFRGIHGDKVIPNKKEIAAWRWVSLKDLKKEIKEKPEAFTPWFKKIIKKYWGGERDGNG